jgi:hypothetical protein
MPPLTFGSNSSLSTTDDARLSRLEAGFPQSRAGGVLYSKSPNAVPSNAAVLSSGLISPTQGIAATGNAFPFVVQGNFGFSWNGTTLTIYWDGSNGSSPFVIRRADGTQISVPRGSIDIAGLSGTTLYSFAPFISVAQPERVSFVLGDAGSPRYAFSPASSAASLATASQTQRLTSNERLTDGLIYFTTGASGTSTAGNGTSSNGSNPYTGQADSGNTDAFGNPIL